MIFSTSTDFLTIFGKNVYQHIVGKNVHFAPSTLRKERIFQKRKEYKLRIKSHRMRESFCSYKIAQIKWEFNKLIQNLNEMKKGENSDKTVDVKGDLK